jgi:diguanylate cyclase (GGDEF)-like protein/PAS domain S-box-containing protein
MRTPKGSSTSNLDADGAGRTAAHIYRSDPARLRWEVDERQRTEQALRASEERFRNLIEGSIQGILIERGRKPLFVNQAFARILGYDSPAEVLALESLEAHVAAHERARLTGYTQARLRGDHAPVQYEYDAVRKDGSIITLENVVRVVNWDGAPAIQNTVIDVSELKRAEHMLRAVIDAVPAIINAKDEHSRYIFMNRYQADLYGVKTDHAVGKTAGELLGAQYGTYTQQLDRNVLDTGKVIPYFEEQYRDAQGVLRTFLTTKVPVHSGGAARNVATVSLEITRRKEAQEALRLSEARYHALYDDNPSMFFTLDDQGTILSVNRFGAEQLGYKVDELLGRPVAMLHQADDEVTVRDHFSACFREPHRVHRWEICKRHKDGTHLWMRESARVVDSIDGSRTLLTVCEDITETRNLSEQLSYQATHDALTGLVNRREFENRLQRTLQTARGAATECALCYLDLDQFKVINDTCGHAAGDELLRRLGSLLQHEVRKRDTLARLGGDEFGILMEHCSLPQARRVAKAVRRAIQTFRFVWDDKIFSVGVSIGLVPITSASGNMAQVMSAADTACYAAKDAGRNRIHVYYQDDAELVRRYGEMQWVSRINRALEEGRFHLMFQPIAPCSDRQQHGDYYELLLRMEDEDGAVVWPESFLPSAERYNLSAKIDRWVIDKALDWLSRHRRQLERLYLCSINLSGHSLSDGKFLEFIIAKLSETDVPPAKICFEITETVAIVNLNSAQGFITALKKLGCRFALDDFGSGLSSFAYLKTLPVDFIKIDGLFVRDIVSDPIAFAMVSSINQIGHVMGKQTIAEFAESDIILERLRAIGVDYVQGYAIGRPRAIQAAARVNAPVGRR